MGMIRGVAAVAEVARRGNRGGDCGVVEFGLSYPPPKLKCLTDDALINIDSPNSSNGMDNSSTSTNFHAEYFSPASVSRTMEPPGPRHSNMNYGTPTRTLFNNKTSNK